MFGLSGVTGPHYRKLALQMLADDDLWDRCADGTNGEEWWFTGPPIERAGIRCRYKGAYYAQAPSHLDKCEGQCRVEQICVLITLLKEVYVRRFWKSTAHD